MKHTVGRIGTVEVDDIGGGIVAVRVYDEGRGSPCQGVLTVTEARALALLIEAAAQYAESTQNEEKR